MSIHESIVADADLERFGELSHSYLCGWNRRVKTHNLKQAMMQELPTERPRLVSPKEADA